MWRRFTILLALLLGMLTGTALVLKSDRVASNLRLYLEQLAHKRFDVDLHIEGLAIELWPPRVHLLGVTATLPRQPTPTVELGSVAISIDPWPTATGALVVRRLEIDGMQARIDTQPPPSPTPATRDGATHETRSPIDVQTLIVHGADLELRRGDERLRLFDSEVTMRPAPGGRREVSVRVGRGSGAINGRAITGLVELQASLLGSLDRPRAITLDKLALEVNHARLQAKGEVLIVPDTRIALDASLDGMLEELEPYAPQLPAMQGRARATLRWHGSLLTRAISGTVRVDGLAIRGITAGDLDVSARIEGSRLNVEHLTLTHPQAGAVTASFGVDINKDPSIDGVAHLKAVSLPTTLELAGLTNAWVNAQISGDVKIQGKLSPLALALDTSLVVNEFRTLNQSFHAPSAKDLLHLGPVGLNGKVAITARGVSLNDITLTRGSSRGQVRGTFSYVVTEGLHLTYSTNDLSLEEIGNIAGVAYRGRGALHSVISGAYNNPIINSTLDMAGFAAAGYGIGDIQGGLVYSGLTLSAERISGHRGGGTFTASGRIDFNHSEFPTVASATLSNTSLSDILTTMQLPLGLEHHLQSRVSGNVELEGPLLAANVESSLHAPSVSFDGTNLGPLVLDTTYRGEDKTAEVRVDVDTDESHIHGAVVFAPDSTLVLDTELRDVSLDNIGAMLGGIDIRGVVSAKAHLAGPYDRLDGYIEATSPNLIAYRTTFGETTLKGSVVAGDLSLSGATTAGQASLEAKIQFSARVPYNLTLRFNDLRLAALWPGMGDISAVVTGSVFSQGLLTNAAGVQADIVVDSGRATVLGMSLSSARPIRVQFAAGTLHIVDFAVQGAGLAATLSGNTNTDGQIDLALTGTLELETARANLARLAISRGRLGLDLRLNGTWDVPYVYGEVTLKDSLLRVRNNGQTFDEVQGRAVFTGRSLTLDAVTARVGGGQLTLSGQVALPIGKDPDFDLRAELREVGLRPSAELKLAVSGELRLQGERKNLELRGGLEIDSLRYTANIDLEQLIPKRNVPPLRVPVLDSNDAVRLNIRLLAKDSVVVTSPVLDAELHADLVITGTTERIGLVGSMAPLWARARYQDNTFTVERASILFTDEYRIATEFDLRARTQACGMQITVNIQGSSNGYNVMPTGTDESGQVAPQDVLACLQLGLRVRDLRSSEAGLLSDRLAASSIDALWTVSGLDQQVRRILPIVDELRISSSWSQRSKRTTPRMVVGKEIGTNLQLAYSRALDVEDDQAFSVAYKVNELTTMLGSWNTGSEAQLGDLGLDLRLRWEFQ